MSIRSINIEETLRRSLIWLLLFSLPVLLSMDSVTDPDIWWHLRVGQWILEHGQVPRVDVFSAYGAGHPWVAYSWLFDILVFLLYRQFGLLGIAGFNVAMTLVIAVALYISVRQGSLPISAEVALVATAMIAMAPVYSPRPWLFTILFFILELNCIFAARNRGHARRLYLLAPLFALWANLHIQFVYGLAVFGLYILELLLARIKKTDSTGFADRAQPRFDVLLIFLGCVAATLLNPYAFSVYKPVIEYVEFTRAFQIVTELLPVSFQILPDWMVGFLLLLTAFVLGWQRRWLIFPTALLLVSAVLGIRARRDVWLAVVSSVVIITHLSPIIPSIERYHWNWLNRVLVSVGLFLVSLLIARQREISAARLQKLVKEIYPVDAVAFIKEKRFSGPLYNHFNWGGYLIWTLPELPVAMDGRTNLHGDARISRSVDTWLGKKGWESDPELAKSRLVVASPKEVLASLLRTDGRFRLVYEDKTAVVFIAKGS